MSVEGSLMAVVKLPVHVLAYLLHGHMTRSFYESLHVFVPRAGYEFAHGVKLRELSRVVSVGCAARPQAVTE